jgi:hypothetical protein
MIVKYEAFGGTRIGKGNRSARKKPASVPLCPSQIQHDLSWDGTGGELYELSLMLIWKYVWLYYVKIFCRMSRLTYERGRLRYERYVSKMMVTMNRYNSNQIFPTTFILQNLIKFLSVVSGMKFVDGRNCWYPFPIARSLLHHFVPRTQ